MTVVNPGGGGSSAAFAFGTAAARPAPAAGNAKTGYFATDTGAVSYSDGAVWQIAAGAFSQGTAAGRPAASANALYYATDTGEWFIANAAGNAWQPIAQAGTGATFFTEAASSGLKGQFVGQFTAGQYWDFGASGKVIANNMQISTGQVGNGFGAKEGANAKQGTIAAMTAGTITVANTSVTATSRIFVCRGPGGTNPGAWYVSAQTAATSFVATSTNAADTGTGVFEIFEPG